MKSRLRRTIQETLAAMPPEAAARKSRLACERLIALPEFQQARVVMIYLPMAHEVDTAAIAQAAWAGRKVVLAPKANWEQRSMVALRIDSMDDRIVRSGFGVLEPAGGEPWPVEKIDFIVAPAVAFNRRGYRLGHGAGFYDRFLAAPGMRAVTCGLGFVEQCVEELPVECNDWPLDMLVTDKEVLRFNHRRSGRSTGARRGGQETQ